MKNILFVFILFPFLLSAQNNFPSYPKIVTEFVKLYSYTPEQPVDGINFAKMKDGWHLQWINQVTEDVKKDELFWSAQSKSFLSLSGLGKPVADLQIEDAVTGFLQTHNIYNIFPYERCAYYGYSQWPEDMIRDFGNGDKRTYSDTLLEGLGRAYSISATKFLWYQMGMKPSVNDSLKRKLNLLELPSRARIDSVNYYTEQAIQTYKTLADKYPKYMTLVGNSSMKVLNEHLSGYMHMLMSGYDSLGMNYLKAVQPNATIKTIALNYLSNCPPNAILFTFGDNDTYPLWFVQQTENLRKDVAVININMLGMPVYIDMLRKKQIVKFSTSPKSYGDRSFLYFIKTGEATASISLPQFLQAIQNKMYTSQSNLYGTMAGYKNGEIRLAVDLNRFRKLTNQPYYSPVIKIKLEDYMVNDQFMILDIVNSNLYNRPVYFTAPYELFNNYLQRQGLVYQLLPLDTSKLAQNEKISVLKTKDYLLNKFRATPSNDFSSGLVADQNLDATAYNIYFQAARYYLHANRKDSANYFINDLLKAYKNNLAFTTGLMDIASVMIDLGRTAEAHSLLLQQIEMMFQLYKQPSAYYPYMSRKTVLNMAINAQALCEFAHLDRKRLDEIVSYLNKQDF